MFHYFPQNAKCLPSSPTINSINLSNLNIADCYVTEPSAHCCTGQSTLSIRKLLRHLVIWLVEFFKKYNNIICGFHHVKAS